jgi:hypothetical protein
VSEAFGIEVVELEIPADAVGVAEYNTATLPVPASEPAPRELTEKDLDLIIYGANRDHGYGMDLDPEDVEALVAEVRRLRARVTDQQAITWRMREALIALRNWTWQHAQDLEDRIYDKASGDYAARMAKVGENPLLPQMAEAIVEADRLIDLTEELAPPDEAAK